MNPTSYTQIQRARDILTAAALATQNPPQPVDYAMQAAATAAAIAIALDHFMNAVQIQSPSGT